MNSSKKLAATLALTVSAGLAGAGCMAQPEDTDEPGGQDELAGAPADQASGAKAEKTGEAAEKCGWGGGWGGFGNFLPYPGWGGFCGGFGAFGPFGGWGSGCGCGGWGPLFGGATIGFW